MTTPATRSVDETVSGVDSARAWLVVVATFLATATIFAIAYSFSLFLSSMAEEFGAGNGATALMFGLTIFLLFILGVPAGRAADRWGPRPVVLLGCAVTAGGLYATSFVNDITLGYLTYGGGIGIGSACCYVPLVSEVSAWFERHRTVAVGVAVSGIGVGTLFGPPIVERLIAANGWRDTYRLLAVVALVGLLAAAALAARAPRSTGAESFDYRVVLTSPVFRSLYLAGFLMTLSLFVPFVFLQPYAEDQGISPTAAATLISFLGVGSLVGRLFLGLLAARLGLLRLYQLSFAVLGLSYVIWLADNGSYPVLAVFAFVLGTSYGGYVALSPAAMAELFGVVGLGTLLGTLYTAAGIGGLIGPPIAGWLIDTSGGYTLSILVALVMGMASVVVLRQAVAAASD